MIILYTDFGWQGPYVGQIKALLQAQAPDQAVIDLMHDAPTYQPRAAGYLLASLIDRLPEKAIIIGVVDPGVGNPERKAVMIEADGRRLVGPDNGLFNVIAKRASQVKWRDILWQPEYLSSSFHGRDLFAPVAAMLSKGEIPQSNEVPATSRIDPQQPDDLAEIIYIDHYGNCMTGIRASQLDQESEIEVGKYSISKARTFSDVPRGRAFWFENSNGLVEIAINMGNAAKTLDIEPGDKIV
ncbi:MAG: SAM-dependent chlorinase/fluorinase, partial [Gammaproteobacteria bacterium]|nr:SAM-dependent chlorinase/fluorinase [Gammaproteobacteria bacterium]